MFKKKCLRCNEKIGSKHSFCEFCGSPQKKHSQEDWGMLGKDDVEGNFQSPFLAGINGGILNRMIGSAMKMLEQEMQREMTRTKNPEVQPKTHIKLMINGKEIDLNNIKNNQQKMQENKDKIFIDNFSKTSLERFSKLPKKEPKTNMKRFADKIIYEIEMPEIDSMKDVSIVKLENSIEIKAVGKKKAYSKLIPINLPIKYYIHSKGKLTLELDSKN